MSWNAKAPKARWIDSSPAVSSYTKLAEEYALLIDPPFAPTAEDLALFSLVYGRDLWPFDDCSKVDNILKEVLYFS